MAPVLRVWELCPFDEREKEGVRRKEGKQSSSQESSSLKTSRGANGPGNSTILYCRSLINVECLRKKQFPKLSKESRLSYRRILLSTPGDPSSAKLTLPFWQSQPGNISAPRTWSHRVWITWFPFTGNLFGIVYFAFLKNSCIWWLDIWRNANDLTRGSVGVHCSCA